MRATRQCRMRSLLSARTLRVSVVALGAFAVGACAVVPERVGPPPPALELLQADAVTLPPQCLPTTSMQVSFTIDPSGRTSDIQPSTGPECAQAALVSWVASFRYAPLAARTPASVEWVLVAAARAASGRGPE